ncbi:hypothetical protein Avbf_00169, partial [Armadillidium vulgare]
VLIFTYEASEANEASDAISCVLALVCFFSNSVRGDSSPSVYELPSNATVVNGGPIITGFSCDGLGYGYYADVANGCRVFHVCFPYATADNFQFTRMFSFICGLGTVFNQAKFCFASSVSYSY